MGYIAVLPPSLWPTCAEMRRTSPMHVLAFALCIPLFALAVPTASQYQLPPDRSVDVPNSFPTNFYNDL